MKHYLRLLIVVLALLALAGCGRGDEEANEAQPLATPTAAAAAPTATGAPAATAALLPTAAAQPTGAPTDTPAPTMTAEATATATVAATTSAAGQGAPAAGDPAQLMGAWQSIMAVAALNQSLCTALQGLAQTGQGGGLGALAVTAGLAGAGGVFQNAQQQLAGIMGLPGLGALGGLLQADQAALGDVIGRWSGGQLDAAGAASALAPICTATNVTLGQTRQGAQDAGLSEEQSGSLLDQSKREAAELVGGVNP